MALAEAPPALPPRSAGAALPAAMAPDQLETLWTDLVNAVGRVSAFTRTYFVEAHPVSFAKNIFTIGYDPEFSDHLALVDNSKNHTLLQTKLSELGFPNAQIRFVISEEPAERRQARMSQPAPAEPAPAEPSSTLTLPTAAAAQNAPAKPQPVPFNKEDFKNDPLIQKALELFKGQIVEVRS
jgi:hypothetical protein